MIVRPCMLTYFCFQRTEISTHADEAEKAAMYPRSKKGDNAVREFAKVIQQQC